MKQQAYCDLRQCFCFVFFCKASGSGWRGEASNNPAIKGVVDFVVSFQGDDTQTVFGHTVKEY